ncbi:MAG: glycosyltransferase, partial [Oscillospiraceae bacterium]|nr:glycosyltransferase [Oscillospiraceae bacterium]
MKKNIWTFHHYGTPLSMTGLTRPYYFAKNLKECGYINTIFSSAYLHYSSENLIKDKKKYIIYRENDAPFVFIRTTEYKKNKFDRIFNIISFMMRSFSVSKIIAKQEGRPNIIIASSPHLLTLIAGIRIARKYKVPCICEVRDLWPESIFEYGSLKKNSLFGKLLQLVERQIYKKADKIIFTMPGGYDYIVEQGWQDIIPKDKCFHINNGVDLEEFDYNRDRYSI